MVSIPNPRMPSQMAHSFSHIPVANVPRSKLRRPHTHKTTFNSGYLVPIYVDEVLPGDTKNLQMSTLTRLASPLKTPIMDNCYLDTFFFFVPNRLLWDNWEKFCGYKSDPSSSTTYTIPQIVGAASGGFAQDELFDHMGVPTKVNSLSVNALFSRAYNLIYNEWFRNQNIEAEITVDKDNGPDTLADYVLRKRQKKADYFTSCLPWPQKGTAVSLPLGTSAPVLGGPLPLTRVNNAPAAYLANAGTNTVASAAGLSVGASGELEGAAGQDLQIIPGGGLETVTTALYANLAGATAATINDIRQAFQLQIMYERDARGGTRYTEVIQAHFGVTNPDFRLQRPELLGMSSSPIIITPIAQQSATTLGLLGGVAAQSGSTSWIKSFTEHGVIIGIAAVRADLTYQQGLDKMWSRSIRTDLYWPALAHLGEQAVYNRELFCDMSSHDAEVFGYQERWSEYRYKNSLITGQMRSNNTATLETWHLAQNFGSLPTLNNTFLQDTPPISRVEAITTQQDWIFDSFFNEICIRPMPTYSVPGLVDHF